MFRFMKVKDQIIALRRDNAALQAANTNNANNIDYLAMMTDVELPVDEGNISTASMMDEMMEAKIMRSKKFNMVRKCYNRGWTKRQVGDAVFCKYITAEEYEIITGDTFTTDKEQIEWFYSRDRIDNAMVAFCVGRGITEEEYKEITGEKFPG